MIIQLLKIYTEMMNRARMQTHISHFKLISHFSSFEVEEDCNVIFRK